MPKLEHPDAGTLSTLDENFHTNFHRFVWKQMHLMFFYYERFLFLQNKQHFHKSYDFVLARGSNIFEEKRTETR